MGVLRAVGRALGLRPRASSRAAEIRTRFRQRFRELEARYDLAQTTRHNSRHWANADGLSAGAAASAGVREITRQRARYECHEGNSWAAGIVRTLAVDSIGRGPRLQLLTADEAVNDRVSALFNSWARAAKLARVLRIARTAKAVDGEAFLVAGTNRRLSSPVKLAVVGIEADQVATPVPNMDPDAVDGIRFDADGVPTEYHILRDHPGTDRPGPGGPMAYDAVDARWVAHWFRADRPGQRRGISELVTGLPLLAQARRFRLATVAAAETAANYAGVIYTDAPGINPDDVEALDAIELEMRSLLTLPAGWKLGQVRSEHPSTTHDAFVRSLVMELARCTLMPLNKALGNSSGYTFASGKLDRDAYLDAIECERHDCECETLQQVVGWWMDEASLVPGLLPDSLQFAPELPPHSWQWDGFRETDPNKQSAADARLWEIGLVSDEEILARRGVDPEEHERRLERQRERRARLELPNPGEDDRVPDGAAAAAAFRED